MPVADHRADNSTQGATVNMKPAGFTDSDSVHNVVENISNFWI